MHEAPDPVDAPEAVTGGQRRPVDNLNTEDAPAIAVDDGIGFGTDDVRTGRVVQDVAPASDHGCMPDDGRPARMDTGDLVVFRPEPDEVLDVPRRERRVEGRVGGDDR